MSTVAQLEPHAMQRVQALASGPDLAEIDVMDLADEAGYSAYHFSRMFRATLGLSPGRYLSAMRVAEAKRLLLTCTEPVIDVAAAVGFSSLSSFTRRFAASVGLPPGDLRHLADEVAEQPFREFSLCSALEGPGDPRTVDITLDLDEAEEPGTGIWVGWYSAPAPIGLPSAGMLAIDQRHVQLPVCPGSPWLLGFAVPLGGHPHDHLAPPAPLTAVHMAPVTTGCAITLAFSRQTRPALPLLSALPVLRRRLLD
ncbi:helix-turn-helix transcriptional regulator [Agrococcus casei]|uniref:helix-turn-helix transcriptional regulator n=1 Tax=Agrococcus casei TaxID=343512 RepID=UPI003F8F7D82